MRRLRVPQILTLALPLLVAILPSVAGSQEAKSKPAPAPQSSAAGKPSEARDPSQYVGAETCKTCHEDMSKNFEKTPHWKTSYDTRRGAAYQGCEACHGPGKEHVEGGGDKTKIFTFKNVSSADVSERCLNCHVYGEEHSNFGRSAHKTNDVSCVDCHSPHHAGESQYLLKSKQPDLCYTCHLDKRAQFNKPFHHRVNEGLVKCTDCHNQHGGFLTRQLRATSAQDVVCFNCHADKEGPFVYEHHPVKTEGCAACHTPHGSPNPRLLKRSQVNLLCLECHTLTLDSGTPGLPSFHNQAQKYQSCTLCHTQIHGSNLDKVFFK